jgi:PKD repeat protein
VVVQFTPPTADAFTNSIIFASSNGGSSTNTLIGAGAFVPIANFTATPTNGSAPLTVTFNDMSSGTITNRQWSFGDGSTTNTTATNLVYTYTTAGSNTVRLIVTGPVGTSTNTKANLIVVVNPAQLVVNPASRDFGSLTIGRTNVLTFTIFNPGGVSLSGTAVVPAPFFITSGGSFNLAAGQTGTVSVAFVPDSAGTFNRSVVFSSNAGASTNAVNGVGLTPGQINVDPVSYDFGTVALGRTSQVLFAVSNLGDTTVTNGVATISAGAFSIASGNTFSIPGHGSVDVIVRFAPGSVGVFSNRLVISTANGGNSTNALSGAGAVLPVASFTATPTNGTSPLTVTFTDNSTGTITNRFWNFGDGSTLNTNATSITHVYTSAGTNSVTLIVSSPLGDSISTRANYIVVINPPILLVVPGQLDYGAIAIGQTNIQTFAVINAGDLPLTGSAAAPAPFSVSAGSPFNLSAGQTATVTVAFAPVSTGLFSTNVVFTSNGGGSLNLVTGVGVTPGKIAVSPVVMDFGAVVVGTTSQQIFTVTNTGGEIVTNGTVTLTGGGPFTILSGATFSLLAESSTNVVVQFAPATEGSFSNSIIFSTANAGASTNVVIGAGAFVPEAGFTGSPTNGTVPLTVTFTDLSTGTITNRFWNFGDGATTNISGTSVSHTYAAGTYTVQLTVSGPLGTSTSSQTNYVTVVNAAKLVVTPASLSFGTIMIGQTNVQSFSVANTGDLPLTGTASVGAPFGIGRTDRLRDDHVCADD